MTDLDTQDVQTDAADTATEETTEEAKVDPKAPVVVKATNPTADEMTALRSAIAENYNFNVDVKAVKFNFKKSKDKDTGIETIREAVELAIPYPSVEGIVSILEADDGGKQLELLMDAMGDVVNSVARELLYDDTAVNAANFPIEKLSWEAIANMPKAQRRGGGIPKETWEEFAQNYVETMVEITGKKLEQVTNMAKILQNKLSAVKTNIPVLELVIQQLTVYAEGSEQAGEYAECIEFLAKKADTLLHVSPEDLLTNL